MLKEFTIKEFLNCQKENYFCKFKKKINIIYTNITLFSIIFQSIAYTYTFIQIEGNISLKEFQNIRRKAWGGGGGFKSCSFTFSNNLLKNV